MTSTTDRIVNQMLADLDVAHKATVARRAREDADKRLNDLSDYIAIWADPELSDGMDGGQQVFAQLMSARHWRNLRAKALRIARKQQLFGHRPSVRYWLSMAAIRRKSEMQWRAIERRDQFYGAQLVSRNERVQMEAAE